MTDDDTSPDAETDADTGADATAATDDTRASGTAPDSPAASTAPNAAREGVSVPQWLATALVVLLGVAIGAGGFAIGRATSDDTGRPDNPTLIRSPGGQVNGPNGLGDERSDDGRQRGPRPEDGSPGFPGGPQDGGRPNFPGDRGNGPGF